MRLQGGVKFLTKATHLLLSGRVSNPDFFCLNRGLH